MRRIADLHAGEAKTDARDAAIIAEAARTLPHALRTLKLADEQIAELSMLCGFDDDLGGHIFLFRIIPLQFIIPCNQPYILPMQ